MHCPACQASLPPGAAFCPACGVHLTRAVTGPTTRLGDLNALMCPKCAHEMEEGFPLEIDGGGLHWRMKWVAGRPKKSRLRMGISLNDRRELRIWTYRCIECGYLESYAPAEDRSEL